MSNPTVRRVITPNDLSVRDTFSRSKSFHIDIYQREYKWTEDQVETLLHDLELRFDTHDRNQIDPIKIQTAVQEEFTPYYLNTFLTHAEAASVAIVDGQQRLTTLLLLLIKLRNILVKLQGDTSNKGYVLAPAMLEKLIYEIDDLGQADRFKIFNKNREAAFRAVLENDSSFIPDDETQSNIKSNYGIISDYLDDYLGWQDTIDPQALAKITYYIYYILERISIVEIKIEDQHNVAMIFEVVNDRGLGLQPNEILKGKLIGSLPRDQKEEANAIWTSLTNEFFKANLSYDVFLQTFFRSKFSDQTSYIKFSDEKYHYEVQRNQNILSRLGNFRDNSLLYQFVKGDLQYFGRLYLELRTSTQLEYVFYNRLNRQDQQFLLIMSAIENEDPLRGQKIDLVSKKFDQLYVILSLLGAFDSRDIQRDFQALNATIRDTGLDAIASAFDKKMLKTLVAKEVIQDSPDTKLSDIFRYELFKGVSNSRPDFSKYVLMRIDRYIGDRLDIPCYMKCSLQELEERFQTKRKYGLHLEHILARNDENYKHFIDPETKSLDEEKFNRIRNLLGMVLLLKDRQNESSNNEHYGLKVNRYKTSNFLWNQLLVGHLDVVDQRNVPPSWHVHPVEPTSDNCFPDSAFMPRQRAVFSLVKEIWDF